MDTTTQIPAELDRELLTQFFADLGTELPDLTDQEALHFFKSQQDMAWGIELQAYQAVRKLWQREWVKLQQLLGAKAPNEEKIEAQEIVFGEHSAELARAMERLLQARGKEEVARALPDLVENPAVSAFVAVQLRNARAYLKMA